MKKVIENRLRTTAHQRLDIRATRHMLRQCSGRVSTGLLSTAARYLDTSGLALALAPEASNRSAYALTEPTLRREVESRTLTAVIDAHGGMRNWERFSKVRARMTVEGRAGGPNGSKTTFADGVFDIDLRQQSVLVLPPSEDGPKMRFRPNMLAIETAGKFVETQYNPRLSFPATSLEEWDDFQKAYVCSYSAWNIFHQPFFFMQNGFQIEDMSPWVSEGKAYQRFRVRYPLWVASHSREMTCYIDENALFRRQDSEFEVLGSLRLSSFQSDYADIQGVKLALFRRLCRTEDLALGNDAAEVAIMRISDVEFS